MRFANWYMLLLFILYPALIYLYARHRSGGSVRFSSVSGLAAIASSPRLLLRHVPFALRLLALACWIVALARPQSGHTFKEVETEGVDIVLTIDTSQSMEARDLEFNTTKRTRLEVAKEVLAQFIKNRANDRLALVVFGENAFTQCPLTLDHGVVQTFVEGIVSGHAGGRATAIGDGLATAVKRLKDLPAKSKVVILLTDGRNNSGEIPPKQAAELAATYDVKVYTVGVGTRGKAPFIEETIFGPQVRYEEVDIDEATLKELATLTGGRYFRATDSSSLKEIYATIDRLEKYEVKVKEHMEFNERFIPIVLAGLVLILLDIFLSGTWLKKVP